MRLIDADALMQEIIKIRGSLQMLDNTQSADKMLHGLRIVEIKVENAPTIEPKRGKWIDKGDRYWYCSECDTKDTDTWDWCHGCGARMKGADDE